MIHQPLNTLSIERVFQSTPSGECFGIPDSWQQICCLEESAGLTKTGLNVFAVRS